MGYMSAHMTPVDWVAIEIGLCPQACLPVPQEALVIPGAVEQVSSWPLQPHILRVGWSPGSRLAVPTLCSLEA